MGKTVSNDVPRPQDGPEDCVRRIMAGEYHALIDLALALEREGDPRGPVVDRLILTAVERIKTRKGTKDFVPWAIAVWQEASVSCLRVMLDKSVLAQLERAERLLGLQDS